MTAKNNKNKGGDFGLGEILLPVVDLLSILLVKAVGLLTDLLVNLFNRYVIKKDLSEDAPKIEREFLKNKTQTYAQEAIGYSVTRRRNILGHELNRSGHTAVVGASGAGKTVLFDTLMFDDMRNGKPIIYLDPKGDNETLTTFVNLCLITGREFAIFSDYYQGIGSCKINPVKEGTPTNIADRIFDSFEWSEEHYAQICYDALFDSIDSLLMINEEVSFKSIYHKLLFLSDPARSKEVPYYKRDDINGIISRIGKIMKSDFGKRLDGTDALSFLDIRNSKKCVYIGISVLGFSKISRSLGKIILRDVGHCSYEAYKIMTPEVRKTIPKIGLYVDELSAIITPNEFIELLNKIRGAEMEISFGFQSPSDIKKVDQQLLFQVLENTSNWFIFKQRMSDGAQLFAESIGTNESTKQTIRVEDGQELTQGSQRVVEEMTAHSNIIKNLGKGQCLMLRHYPTRLDLLNVKYISPEILSQNIEYLKRKGFIKNEEVVKGKTQVLKELKKSNDVILNWGENSYEK